MGSHITSSIESITPTGRMRWRWRESKRDSFQFSIFPYELLMFYSLHSAPSWGTQSDNLIGMHAYTARIRPGRNFVLACLCRTHLLPLSSLSLGKSFAKPGFCWVLFYSQVRTKMIKSAIGSVNFNRAGRLSLVLEALWNG